ncbi:methyltransferase domain-containing protein [Neiella sp. HB171785]|uniref:Methyltransferase domain-containing protein n=1 Tax=Neiella litorisoli TaxID=2771431 RepID=A0A8J6QMH7_9GAMM|nr:methyltransferase domain-containing protein [Neiella litorisoli]MBD1391182.1 methyltransferase domain-containing protein [Neiella litorisoli]
MPLSWQELAQGPWLKQQLEPAIVPMLERMFGYYMVTLGPLGDTLDTSASSISRQLRLSSLLSGSIRGKETELPLSENSIDACVVPFCLDFCNDPHQMVREVHRVVISDGHILLAGFNPLSLVATGKLWPSWRKRSPWNGRFFTRNRISDWFQLLGCEIIASQTLAFSSLLGSKPANHKIQQVGQRYAPWAGSVYVMLMKKREVPLTPVKPSWKAVNRIKTVGALTGAGVAGRQFSTGQRSTGSKGYSLDLPWSALAPLRGLNHRPVHFHHDRHGL